MGIISAIFVVHANRLPEHFRKDPDWEALKLSEYFQGRFASARVELALISSICRYVVGDRGCGLCCVPLFCAQQFASNSRRQAKADFDIRSLYLMEIEP
ncbi:hypothetical protein LOAG_04457 [Loa loa]|uniref:Uncharacterized protein n=1 Tax=Loa loa TaxID=7209 RepID=A0A1S0U2C7_LOALO|nr:hypothetical protein LOAG_04457 [Loa loa]EFO24032.1 hypothetical protein LOAG_04457 [Loa loa]